MSQLRANSIVNSAGDGSPSFPFGLDTAGVNYAATAGIATDAQGLIGTPNITVGNVVAAAATFSGDVSIGGTLTYEDVTSIDSVGVITARQGIDVTAGNISMTGSGNIDLSSGSGNITLGSNALYAGGVQYRYYVSGDDSILYHGNADGSLVSVTDTNFIVSNTGFAQTSAVFTPTGSAELYHNNSKKLETTGAGVTVTGTTSSNQVSVSGVSTFNDDVTVDGVLETPQTGTVRAGRFFQVGKIVANTNSFGPPVGSYLGPTVGITIDQLVSENDVGDDRFVTASFNFGGSVDGLPNGGDAAGIATVLRFRSDSGRDVLSLTHDLVGFGTDVEITGIVTASTGFNGPLYIYESADLNAWYNIPMMAQSTAGGQYSNLMVDNGGIQFNPGSNEFYLGNNIRANGNTGIITATTVDSTFVNPSRLSVSLGSWLEGYKFEEGSIDTSTSLTGTFTYNILNGHVQTWTSATSGNYGPNFIINGSTIDAFTDVGDIMTATVMVASSSHYLAGANIQIDGSSANLDINYVGGSAPSAANGSGYDIYSFTIQKSAATPAYIVTVNALGAN